MGMRDIRCAPSRMALGVWVLFVGCSGAGARALSSASETPGGPSGAPGMPQLVFTAPNIPMPTGAQELFTSDLDGGNLHQLTADGRPRFLPHFSPDGSRLIYSKFLAGGYGAPRAVSVIALYDFATGRETQLTSGGVEIQAVWSPDGKRIAYGTLTGQALWMMNADGSAATLVGRPSGTPDDLRWDDFLWSRDNWLYFTVAQDSGGCFKVRTDRMRPSGAERARISDGGPNCTPNGLQQSGDADPGISPDGTTIYSSRGLPRTVPGRPDETLRHLYRFSSAPFTPGKVETDLSGPAKPNCVAGVPKVSPGGRDIALYLNCPNDPRHAGVTLTDPSGMAYRFVETGFGADWNPTYPLP
jgi:hypothetical protein